MATASASVLYSPAPKMDIANLSRQTLADMKYNQLIKLSHKYNVKKRWAKKDDLIQSLLELRRQVVDEDKDNALNEQMEWVDGRQMFPADKVVPTIDDRESTSRGTFTIEKLDARGTYNLTDVINDIVPHTDVDRRLTFDIPPKKVAVNPANKVVKTKMLTVPYSRASARNTSRLSALKESPLKLSNKSITIKKSKDVLSPLKSTRSLYSGTKPTTGRLPLPNNRQPTVKPCPKPLTSNFPNKENGPKPFTSNLPNKENIQQPPQPNRRKSRSDDTEVRRKSFVKVHATFHTPPTASQKRAASQQKVSSTKTGALSGIKPFAAGKVPDFAKIHSRNFDKMDSLDEYINKKADRVKKLFGTPKVTKPLVEKVTDMNTVSITKEEPITARPLNNKVKIDDARKIISRSHLLRTQTDVKDKNRSHIHGIRTNKRFDLQMKFRNM